MSASRSSSQVQQGDRIFSLIVQACAVLIILILVSIIAVLVIKSQDTIGRFGLDFFTKGTWDPVNEIFGALPYIYGTVVTSILALLLATPFAIGSAIFVSEYVPRRIGDIISFTVELLVAIPSVAYGVWGFLVLKDVLRTTVDPALKAVVGPIPILGGLFRGPLYGLDIFTSSVILAIMILPTILAVSREVVRQVPRLQKEGMIALGATKWEAIRIAIIPYARTGIVGGAMLGLARAIGETMAVTMTIGNASPDKLTGSLFQSTSTLASAIASQFNEAQAARTYGSAVVQLGLVLLIVSSVINLFSRFLVSRTGAKNTRS